MTPLQRVRRALLVAEQLLTASQQPSRSDMKDAISVADEYTRARWQPEDFDLEYLGELEPRALREYDYTFDRIVTRTDPAAYAGLDVEDKIERFERTFLRKSQGWRSDWTDRMQQWLRAGIPPVIVITAPDCFPGGGFDYERPVTRIGDGWGRLNFAIAMGLKVPAWHMVYKGRR